MEARRSSRLRERAGASSVSKEEASLRAKLEEMNLYEDGMPIAEMKGLLEAIEHSAHEYEQNTSANIETDEMDDEDLVPTYTAETMQFTENPEYFNCPELTEVPDQLMSFEDDEDPE